MSRIAGLAAWEILDSRGLPTVLAECRLEGGASATASVPSGRSTGKWEAAELRDGDPRRYDGLGCRRAVDGINGEIASSLTGLEVRDQAQLDEILVDLDGTERKGRLGANAVLAVSLAFARAKAKSDGVELWQHLAAMAGNER